MGTTSTTDIITATPTTTITSIITTTTTDIITAITNAKLLPQLDVGKSIQPIFYLLWIQ